MSINSAQKMTISKTIILPHGWEEDENGVNKFNLKLINTSNAIEALFTDPNITVDAVTFKIDIELSPISNKTEALDDDFWMSVAKGEYNPE